MSRKSMPLYSTAKDTALVLREASAVESLALFRTGVFETRNPVPITNYEQLESGEGCLVVGATQSVKMEAFSLARGGGRRYSLDQMQNPQSVVLRTSKFVKGRMAPFEKRLLPGSMGTISEDAVSIALYSLLAKIIRKRFEKIQEFYVGPEAAAALDSGIRLTATNGSPPGNDLVRLAPSPPASESKEE